MSYSASDIKRLEQDKEEALMVFLILQLALQGRRFEQIIGQMIASYVMASDGNSAAYLAIMNDVEEETLNLMIDPSNIWNGLLPGPPTEHQFQVVETTPEAQHGMDDYVISIMANPQVRFDPEDQNKRLSDENDVVGESPLNFWNTVINMMLSASNRHGAWPEEEMVAWITHKATSKHWLMTWDQAKALEAHDAFTDALMRASFENHGEMDDFIQGISDMMSIAGDEYIANQR